MKKYRVYVDYETKIIEVEAKNPEEAEAKAEQQYKDYKAEICSTEAVELDKNGEESYTLKDGTKVVVDEGE